MWRRIAVDSSGSAYVTGFTDSTDFPTLNPYQTDQPLGDVFVTKLSPSGNSLVYSTYLGGNDVDNAHDIVVDTSGNAYVTGFTNSTDFPTQNPYQMDQIAGDAFVTKIGSPLAQHYFTLSPCRVVDTRNAMGPFGGPALAPGADRSFTVAGQCGVPTNAKAVSINLTVTAPTAAGDLELYPAGTPVVVSDINYLPGQTRANNAIVKLSNSGALAVRCAQASGTAHFLLDVNGYYE